MKKRSLMKRCGALLLAGMMLVGTTACSNGKTETSSDGGSKKLDKLTVYFVPSRDPDEIVTATDPLKGLLKDELTKAGYEVGEVDISVGTSYEAVGEALSAGTADVGFIPGGTYVLYDDGADVILTATRAGLSKDSAEAKDWNDGQATEAKDTQANYYRALIITGPTEKGKELADKVNSGTELTFDDLSGANWSVMSSSSSAGYIYPSLWLQDKFSKKLTDLPNLIQADSYGSSFARLANGEADVLLAYADARRDYAEKWTSEYGRSASIWEETNVIGVTDPIYNDTISVSKNSKIMTDDLKAALQTAFINIAGTEEGKKVVTIYSHEGYVAAKSTDYDKERAAQELIQKLNSGN
jgi:phosphonate transport system substrate-binding protein